MFYNPFTPYQKGDKETMTEKEFNQLFAENLNYYMSKTGTTRAELAKLLNVSVTSVANWCNALKTPRMDKVDRICAHFGIKRSDLMSDASADQTSGQTEGYYFDDEAAELAQEIYEDPELRVLLKAKRDLSKDDMEVIVNMIKALQAKDGK